jgi:hypothetical protein
MLESYAARYERLLRQRLRRFLGNKGPRADIFSALSEWQKNDWRPYLFGGVLRDLLVLGGHRYPRDVDVVLTNGSLNELETSLRPYLLRRTRFGGFQLERGNWHFDVWPLQMTWAFQNGSQLVPSPANLPKTTFLNVEAIAAAIEDDGSVGDIFEAGFFEAIHTRTLDINLKINPYPPLAAIRALATAHKLRFFISAKLASYILDVDQQYGSDSLVAAQSTHYGYVRFQKRQVRWLVRYITSKLNRDPNSPIVFPGSEIRQLTLWQQ